MDEVTEVWITTKDNPYDPFTQYEDWEAWDIQKGYHTDSYVGRIAKTSKALTELDMMLEIERAIDEIIKLNPLDIYVKVYEDDFLN